MAKMQGNHDRWLFPVSPRVRVDIFLQKKNKILILVLRRVSLAIVTYHMVVEFIAKLMWNKNATFYEILNNFKTNL